MIQSVKYHLKNKSKLRFFPKIGSNFPKFSGVKIPKIIDLKPPPKYIIITPLNIKHIPWKLMVGWLRWCITRGPNWSFLLKPPWITKKIQGTIKGSGENSGVSGFTVAALTVNFTGERRWSSNKTWSKVKLSWFWWGIDIYIYIIRLGGSTFFAGSTFIYFRETFVFVRTFWETTAWVGIFIPLGVCCSILSYLILGKTVLCIFLVIFFGEHNFLCVRTFKGSWWVGSFIGYGWVGSLNIGIWATCFSKKYLENLPPNIILLLNKQISPSFEQGFFRHLLSVFLFLMFWCFCFQSQILKKN